MSHSSMTGSSLERTAAGDRAKGGCVMPTPQALQQTVGPPGAYAVGSTEKHRTSEARLWRAAQHAAALPPALPPSRYRCCVAELGLACGLQLLEHRLTCEIPQHLLALGLYNVKYSLHPRAMQPADISNLGGWVGGWDGVGVGCV